MRTKVLTHMEDTKSSRIKITYSIKVNESMMDPFSFHHGFQKNFIELADGRLIDVLRKFLFREFEYADSGETSR